MKIKIIVRFFFIKILFFIVLLFSGCWAYYPPAVDIPLIKEKNDLRIDGGISLPSPSINSTISYGLTNHIAIQLHGSLAAYFSYQGAIGYYKDLGNLNILEVYTGFGKLNYAYSNRIQAISDYPTDFDSNYKQYFVQINFGKINTNFDYGIGIKTGLMSSKLQEIFYYLNQYLGQSQVYSDNNFFIEPTLFVRMGGKHFKVKPYIGYSWINKFLPPFNNCPLNFGMSLNYNL